jgi:hypothetical protein
MKYNTALSSLLALATSTAVTRAGTAEPSPEIAAAKEAPWIKPVIDIRMRYEFAVRSFPCPHDPRALGSEDEGLVWLLRLR